MKVLCIKPAGTAKYSSIEFSLTFLNLQSHSEQERIRFVAWRLTPWLTTMLIKGRTLPKTILEVLFITFAVSETRTGRLSSANTAALYTPIHLRFVKAKHLFLPAVACENKQELVLLITGRYWKKNLGNSLGKSKVNYNSGWETARLGNSSILHCPWRVDTHGIHL